MKSIDQFIEMINEILKRLGGIAVLDDFVLIDRKMFDELMQKVKDKTTEG